jgi:hypothetical protein
MKEEILNYLVKKKSASLSEIMYVLFNAGYSSGQTRLENAVKNALEQLFKENKIILYKGERELDTTVDGWSAKIR